MMAACAFFGLVYTQATLRNAETRIVRLFGYKPISKGVKPHLKS